MDKKRVRRISKKDRKKFFKDVKWGRKRP